MNYKDAASGPDSERVRVGDLVTADGVSVFLVTDDDGVPNGVKVYGSDKDLHVKGIPGTFPPEGMVRAVDSVSLIELLAIFERSGQGGERLLTALQDNYQRSRGLKPTQE